MQIIGDAFAGYYQAKRREGEFGMEIETETKSVAEYPPGFFNPENDNVKGHKHGIANYKIPIPKWRAVSDNSLRNFGIEFIFKEPYVYKEARDAIKLFGEATKGVKFIKDPPGASVHVHINMFNETFLTLGNFCTLYILFENILQEFSGEFRRSNLFAMPSRCSEPIVWNIISMFEQLERGDANAISWAEENVKYGGLNIAPLHFLGSIESRTMRGTTDPKELLNWLGILNSLLTFARTEGLTPRDIISGYRHKNLDFFYEVFGDYTDILEAVCQGRMIQMIDRNLYYAGSIASSVKDWGTLGDLIKPKEVKARKPKTVKDQIIDDIAAELQVNAWNAVGAAGGNQLNWNMINNLGIVAAGPGPQPLPPAVPANPNQWWDGPDEDIQLNEEF
jgi:hypothetical protein